MTGIEILLLCMSGLIGLGALETLSHRNCLREIKTRIHVAGTRGKSSVTRLIAAGLREAGITNAAKTTGTLARMILPDGREVPIFRPAGTSIIEQTRIVATAARLGVDVLVVECMALQPVLHWLSERHLIKATIGVITNARADHLDVMGPTETDVAKALAGMIPIKGILFTAEQKHLDIFKRAAEDRKTELISVGPDDVGNISNDDLAGFPYLEHRENLALALKILEKLSVPKDVALRGMWKADPDPGALTHHRLDFFGRDIVFVNGFAANDPFSTEKIWRMSAEGHGDARKTIAVFNMRADRPHRTVQLARHANFWHQADGVVLMGTGAYSFSRQAQKAGYELGKIVYADFDRVEDIFETIVGVSGPRSLVVGMGNIGEQGLELTKFFRNRSRLGGAP